MKNDWNNVRQEGTGKDRGYDIKVGCEAGDDIWTIDSSDDKETREAVEVAEIRMPRFFPGVTRKDRIRNVHIRGTLKVDRFG